MWLEGLRSTPSRVTLRLPTQCRPCPAEAGFRAYPSAPAAANVRLCCAIHEETQLLHHPNTFRVRSSWKYSSSRKVHILFPADARPRHGWRPDGPGSLESRVSVPRDRMPKGNMPLTPLSARVAANSNYDLTPRMASVVIATRRSVASYEKSTDCPFVLVAKRRRRESHA